MSPPKKNVEDKPILIEITNSPNEVESKAKGLNKPGGLDRLWTSAKNNFKVKKAIRMIKVRRDFQVHFCSPKLKHNYVEFNR